MTIEDYLRGYAYKALNDMVTKAKQGWYDILPDTEQLTLIAYKAAVHGDQEYAVIHYGKDRVIPFIASIIEDNYLEKAGEAIDYVE